MRIVLVLDSLALGGAQKHVCQLARTSRQAGHEVVVVALNAVTHERYRAELERADVELVVFGRWRVATGWALVKLVGKASRADVLVAVLFFSTILARLAGWFARCPVCTGLQARNVDYPWWKRWLVRLTARSDRRVFSNSRAASAWAIGHEGVVPATLRQVPNAVEPAGPGAEFSWRELGAAALEGKRVLGSLGRLCPQKGYDIALRAFAAIAVEHDVFLWVAGIGPDAKALCELARALGVEDRVVWAGAFASPEKVLPRLTGYLQPSRFEGTPNALMEAMEAGVPVVASAVDGVTEVLDNETGWLVVPEDVRGLATALRELLTNDGEARRRAAAARIRMREGFRLEALRAAYLPELESVARRRPRTFRD